MNIKRMKYFKGEFLTAEDFQCEQDYHRNMRQLLNATLHTPGIVSGLNVTAGDGTVVIEKGVAIDRLGRELILDQDLTENITSPMTVAIKYVEIDDSATTSEEGFAGVKRTKVGVDLCPGSDPDAILLAQVTQISPVTLDPNFPRTYASPIAPGNLTIGQDLTVNGNLTVQGETTTVKTQKMQGNVVLGNEDTDTVTIEGGLLTGHSSGRLKINSPVDITGALSVTGALSLPTNGLNVGTGQLAVVNGNVGIGTSSPENSEGWTKVLDMLGGTTTKLSVRTTNIDARLLAHESGWWGAPAGMIIGTKTNHSLSFGTNAASRMTIDSSGNVGIGTIGPARAKLEVSGVVGKTVGLFGKDHQGIALIASWPTVGFNAYYDGGFKSISPGWTGHIHVDQGNGSISFKTGEKTTLADQTVEHIERLTVTSDGNVGIGTTSPENSEGWTKVLDMLGWITTKLSVRTTNIDARLLAHESGWWGAPAGMIIGTKTNHSLSFGTNAASRMTIDSSGNVGIGTIPASGVKLDVNGGAFLGYETTVSDFGGLLKSGFYQNSGTHGIPGDVPDSISGWTHLITSRHSNTTNNHQLQIAANYGVNDRLFFRKIAATASSNPAWNEVATRGSNTFSGNQTINGSVVITGPLGTNGYPATPKTPGWGGGIHTWDVEAEGTMWSKGGYQSGPRDLAENYLSRATLSSGDVVCLDKEEDAIVLSEEAEDPLVIGIISTKPGFLLNVDHDEKGQLYPVSLCGRVPCKVTDENGPITRGDLLTSSSTPGHAMKAKPINGSGYYRPGTIIGKALDPLNSGNGVIDVFVFSS